MSRRAKSPTVAEQIVASLQSAATTNITTFEQLQALLRRKPIPPLIEICTKAKNLVKGDKSQKPGSKVAGKKVAKSVKIANVPSFEIHESPDSIVQALSVGARQKLATEAFNSSLKCLASAAKTRQNAHDVTLDQDQSVHRRTKTKPLQPIPGNAQSVPTPKDCSQPASDEDLDILADCAIVALDCLRELDCDAKSKDDSDGQRLQKGALVLIEKFITLRLPRQALSEASKLYDQYWKRRKGIEQPTEADEEHGQALTVPIRMASDQQFVSEQDMVFMSSYQSHMLRLAILLGSEAINISFISDVRLESLGSPANTVLQGLKSRQLDAEKASQQLRTISQALLKLYSVSTSDKCQRGKRAELNIRLLIEALLIKCESWTIAKYKADFNRELWPHILKGLRRFEVDCGSNEGNHFDVVFDCVSSIASHILKNDAEAGIPVDVVNAVVDISEKSGRYADGVIILRQRKTSVGELSAEHRMLLNWRLVTLQQKSSKVYDTTLSDMLDVASTSTRDFRVSDSSDIDSIFLHGARLRKTVVAIIVALDQETTRHSLSKTEFPISCLSMLSDLSLLLWRLSQSSKLAGELKKQIYSITSFAKAFESIIDVGEKHAPRLSACRDRYDIAVQQCVSSAKDLIVNNESEPELKAVLESLLARTSHLYWLRYANCIKSDIREADAIHLLELSCRPVAEVSEKVQKSASYGIKLEKLAVAHLLAKDMEHSCKCFEDVICYHIRIGALEEATEAALSGPACDVWSRQGGAAYALGKALVSLARLRLTHGLNSTTSHSWTYDNRTLPSIQRCLMFEAQMAIVVDHQFPQDQSQSFTQRCEEMLNLIPESEYRVYRLRFLSQILRILAKNDSISSISILSLIASNGLLEVAPHSTSPCRLSSYADTTFLIAKIQYLMHGGSINTRALEACIKALLSTITGLTDKATLYSSIDDFNFVVNQLQAVGDLGHMLDDTDLTVAALLCMQHALSIASPDNLPLRVDNLTQLATTYHRTGDHVRAGKAYEAAAQLLKNVQKITPAYSKWSLSYIRYLMDVSQAEKAIQIYEDLTTIYMDDKSHEQSSSRDRLQNEYLLSVAAQIASELAFHRGDLSLYTRFAKQSVELSTRIWHVVERSYDGVDTDSVAQSNDSIDGLPQELETLTIASKSLTSQPKPKGSAYWPYIDLHCSALYHMIKVSIHDGLYKDARCYVDQLLKIAMMIGSSTRKTKALSISAFIYAKAGHNVRAVGHLTGCPPLCNTLLAAEDQFSRLLQAETFIELEELGKASTILDALHSSLDHKKSEDSKDSELMGIKRPPVRGKAKVTRPIKAPPKRSTKSATTVTKVTLVPAKPCMPLSQQFIHQKVQALRNLISLTENGASSAALPVSDLQQPERIDTDVAVTNSMMMLQQAFMELSSDAVKCVLDEAAVALPVRYRSSRKSGRVSFLQTTTTTQSDLRVNGKGRAKVAATKSLSTKEQMLSGEKLVLGAQKLLDGLYHASQQSCASDLIHLICKLQSKIALLSSILDAPFMMSSTELVLRCLSPKDIVQDREHAVIEAERVIRQKAQLLTWPAIATLQNQDPTDMTSDYNMDDLADIPETWSILTISLADNHKELLLSRITAGRSPFLLRIPLSRSDFDMDEEEFTFTDAKTELLDIITEANASAHDARGQGDREARKAWYADREALDQRLETWLSNVENIWLGGFRGLMASNDIDEELLTKFGQLLDKVLDKHLPSRQKMGGLKSSKIVLHAHVLELFLGLGHPDEQEIDDATMDLLYFVVDILQFSGEHNAYDEIDFDAMLIDVFDAARSYHSLRSHQRSSSKHTILIVDKEMSSFPWESLACLRSQSVSRMPSLSSVFQRLKKIREQSPSAQSYTIAADQGSIILNPSSDLVSTQKTFQPILNSQLPRFSSIINKTPLESDFTSLLTGSQLLLYFGHGSGAQYIRGRTIRNLDSCAVTLLMGCSSAQMTECGKFESYGMPGYYIGGMSGCMAVVGTLWDVTDRDIDRFALKTMVEWGLIEEDEMVATALERSNKKNIKTGSERKPSPMQDRKGIASLDDAVQKGRDACLLRYLNGAAPVVYGVPVILQ